MTSRTGYKELYDMGYTLRARYPDLYTEGDDFVVWANNYTRVIQTAQLFVRGYLGPFAEDRASVVSVTGRGFNTALGDTLAPSDMCPTFRDDSSAQTAAWRERWLPAFAARIRAAVDGDLGIDDGYMNDFPYICGFESQVQGSLSPFCDTFTQEELDAYEYQQDLRYYYGVGPGADVASKMMTPFLGALVDRLVAGPDAEGKDADGNTFKLPRLLMNFLNDGQLNQLAAAVGVFDDQEPLPTDRIAEDRLWRSSRISPMRGTIALERLNCRVPAACVPRAAAALGDFSTVQGHKNETFVRIRLNDAVFPVPSCHDGPGKSCRLADYAQYVEDKLEAQGSFADICGITDAEVPTKVRGASFFTNLAQPHLQVVKP